VARAAAARIEAGALNNGSSLEDLAREFGLSSRQLRRVLRQELGVAPVQLAQTHRLLLAKQLLTETRLPVIEVAHASGFESVRRFNAVFLSHYRLPPSRLRKSLDPVQNGEPLQLQLGYRPPLAWAELLRFLGDRATAGVECVRNGTYARTLAIGSNQGWLKVEPVQGRNALAVEFSATLAPALAPLLSRIRHVFDLNARPDLIASHLRTLARIGPAVDRCAGLRVPGAFSGFELAWRAVLGQRVSVRAATTLAGRFVDRFGTAIDTPNPVLNRLVPEPERIAEVKPEEISKLGMPRDRALCIKALAGAIADGSLRLEPGANPETTIEQLKEFPGIGEWTAQYIAMRALGWPDAFPHGDLGLLRALGETSAAGLRTIAEAWRPWRAYGVMHVWNSSSSSNGRSRS
jgi:AraC family transcriptional regulator of adaptative response / DNA-3-methyladenine glycosylase II